LVLALITVGTELPIAQRVLEVATAGINARHGRESKGKETEGGALDVEG
jgi:hypothetical protein